VHRHVSWSHDLEPIELEKIVDLKYGGPVVLAYELKVLFADPYKPE